jgi:hypothetical protein
MGGKYWTILTLGSQMTIKGKFYIKLSVGESQNRFAD